MAPEMLYYHKTGPSQFNHIRFREASSRSAFQGIFRLLRKKSVYYRAYKSPPLVPVVSQINLICTIIFL